MRQELFLQMVRGVLLNPRARLGAERGFVRGVVEVHAGSAPAANVGQTIVCGAVP